MTWLAYRNKRGSLNVGRRVEQAMAPITAWYVRSKVKDPASISEADYMPHEDRIDTAVEMDFSDAMRKWES